MRGAAARDELTRDRHVSVPGRASDQLASDELASDELASDELASDELASDELASDELASDEVASVEVASDAWKRCLPAMKLPVLDAREMDA
jgi:hypothetical protein